MDKKSVDYEDVLDQYGGKCEEIAELKKRIETLELQLKESEQQQAQQLQANKQRSSLTLTTPKASMKNVQQMLQNIEETTVASIEGTTSVQTGPKGSKTQKKGADKAEGKTEGKNGRPEQEIGRAEPGATSPTVQEDAPSSAATPAAASPSSGGKSKSKSKDKKKGGEAQKGPSETATTPQQASLEGGKSGEAGTSPAPKAGKKGKAGKAPPAKGKGPAKPTEDYEAAFALPKPPEGMVAKKFLWTTLTSNRFANSIFSSITAELVAESQTSGAPKIVIDLDRLANCFFLQEKGRATRGANNKEKSCPVLRTQAQPGCRNILERMRRDH